MVGCAADDMLVNKFYTDPQNIIKVVYMYYQYSCYWQTNTNTTVGNVLQWSDSL